MKTNKILIPLLLLTFLTTFIIFTFLNKKTVVTPEEDLKQTTEVDLSHAEALSNDLQISFDKAISEMNLAKESVVMSNTYFGTENTQNKLEIEISDENNKWFYVASSIKPLYISAVLDLLEIKDLNYQIPLKFDDEQANKYVIAQELSSYLINGYLMDSLISDNIGPLLENNEDLSADAIYAELTNEANSSKYSLSLQTIIKYTLGPSSNWGIAILRNHLAMEKGITEEEAVNLIEERLNNFLKDNGYTANLTINLSSNSIVNKTFNTTYFYEMVYLFELFHQNRMGLNSEIFDFMRESMREVAQDPTMVNRRHEFKSIAKNVFLNTKASIVEKSGYIGLDYAAAPKLEEMIGWDKLPVQPERRIVDFNASSFSRIYLIDGTFVQFNYAIAVPIYITLDPHYEELNPTYLEVKNKILDILDSNINSTLTKYKQEIEVVK